MAKTVIVVHADAEVRRIVRNALEDKGFRTDPTLPPDLVLVDRNEGLELLSALARRWPEAETVRLPELLDPASMESLLGHVHRLLGMRSTRALLAV